MVKKQNWFWLSLFVLACSVATWPILELKINNSMEIWFYDDDPGLVDYRRDLDTFGEWDWLVVAVHARQSIYDQPFLQQLDRASREMELLPKVRRVISLTNAKVTIDHDDILEFRPLFQDEKLSPQQIQQFRTVLEGNPVYRNGLIQPGNSDTALMLIQDSNPFSDANSGRIELVDGINAILEPLDTIKSFALVGTTNLNAELNRSSRHDMYVFYPLVTALLLLAAWYLFRNLRDIAGMLLPVTGALLITVGLMMWLGYELNMVTIMMPAVIMAVLMASVVHYLNTFHQIRLSQPRWPLHKVTRKTVATLWLPYLATTITTSIGFLSLSSAHTLPITLLSVFGAFSLILMFAMGFSVMPSLLQLLWHRSGVPQTAGVKGALTDSQWQSRISDVVRFALRYPKAITLLWCTAAIITVSGLNQLEADSNYVDMFRDGTTVQSAYNEVDQAGFGTSNLNVVLNSTRGMEDPVSLTSLLRLQQAIERLPQVTKTLSLVDVLEEVDRATAEQPTKRDDLNRYDRAQLAQLILTAELSGNENMADLLSLDHKDSRLFVFTQYLSGKGNRELVQQIQQLADQHIPASVSTTVTGIPMLWANQDGFLFASQKQTILYVSVAILITLLCITRSVSISLIGLFINVLPVSMMLGVMGWLGVKIDIATTLIGGVALGLAVDDSIHMLWRYRTELRAGHAVQEAVKRAARHSGRAILITSLLLACGFLVMTASDFKPTAYFGLFTSLTVLLALIADLVLLPSLLSLFHRVPANTPTVVNNLKPSPAAAKPGV